ncbi:MAG: chemotaxis-specific protein-glutamate methyltransferase CheB [Bdellovibrionales bacterium]|nr:chemotaxis-specific protein-glutamate methyltransferase CheB [Bdellovibrionales bacterium]
MIFDSKLMKKWIDNPKEFSQDILLKLVNKCVISIELSPGKIGGFSVFEPRDVTGSFWEKLRSRQNRSEFEKKRFILTAPPYLKHRLESAMNLEKDLRLEIAYSPYVKIKSTGQYFTLDRFIRVVNIDDSPVLLKFLRKSMEEVGFFQVSAQESDPKKAVEVILSHSPDLITLDIQMPGMTGVEVIKELFRRQPFPVLTISSLDLEEGGLVFDALNSGAFDYLQKPRFEERQIFIEELSQKAVLAVEGKTSNLFHSRVRSSRLVHEQSSQQGLPSNILWCLGASTGGTQAITQVLTSLPKNIPPVLIVQHIAAVFSRSFADSLNRLCPFTVKEAEDGEEVKSEHVYIAPGSFQMGVTEKLGRLYIYLTNDPPMNRFKPSVDYLFDSVSAVSSRKIVAGLLTGMGKDGAKGLLDLRQKGAHTFAQDEESCAVYGMPKAAYEMGAAEKVVSLDNIAHTLWAESLCFGAGYDTKATNSTSDNRPGKRDTSPN